MSESKQREVGPEAIRKIADQTSTYIEYVWPKLERRGGVPETPMNRKAKGESNPPMGDHAFDVVEANAEASKYLRFHLEVFEAGERKAANGIHFSRILKDVRYNPGLLLTWHDDEPEMISAFKEITRQVAKGVIFVHGEKAADLIEVFVNPEDARQRQKTREAQKRKTRDTDWLIVERLEELENRGMGREEAKRHLAKDGSNTWSYWRVHRAITGVNRQRACHLT